MLLRKPTDFEQRVYKAVQGVPVGRVVTYAILADILDCRSAQAIGQALRRNPFAPAVPCHRVIRTDLSLGGYFGAVAGKQLEKKRALLLAEGVEFDQQGLLVDRRKLYRPNAGCDSSI